MIAWSPLLLWAACTATEPIPDDLVDPLSTLFADPIDRDADLSAAAVVDVLRRTDGASPLAARVFAPEDLPADRVRLPDDADVVPTDVRRALIHLSPHDVDDHRRADDLGDRACVEGPATLSWVRTFTDDDRCWAGRACRDARASSSWVFDTDDGGAVATLGEDFTRLQVVLDEAEGDLDVNVHRAWATELEGDLGLSALYRLRVWVEDADDPRSTWRLDALWAAGGLDADAWVDELDAAARQLDVFLDAGRTSCTE